MPRPKRCRLRCTGTEPYPCHGHLAHYLKRKRSCRGSFWPGVRLGPMPRPSHEMDQDDVDLPDYPAAADRAYYPHQPKSLAGIATRAFFLGAALAGGLLGAVVLASTTALWRLPFFLAALSAFHFLEFWATAAYNTPRAEVGSFLLMANWPGYALAHLAACAECLVGVTFFPHDRFLSPAFFSLLSLGRAPPALTTAASAAATLAGLLIVLVGQAVRTAAMCQAGASFHHLVQHRRAADHELVTTGIYALLRHPSYFGFFWWALGTQIVMGNAVCMVGYTYMLWQFFSMRVRGEEELLVRFFGDEYHAYRTRVRTWIPFIP